MVKSAGIVCTTGRCRRFMLKQVRLSKKHLLVIIALLVVAVAGLPGCYGATRGSGSIVTRSFNFQDFNRVEVSHAFRAEIIRGSSFSVSVTADDNLFEYVNVTISGNILKIGMRPGYTYFPKALVARITMPDVDSVNIFGASRAELASFDLSHDFRAQVSGASTLELAGLRAEDVTLEAGTASRITGVLNALDVTIEATGASRVLLSGTARSLHLTGSAASNINLGEMKARDATIGLNGASSAEVNLSGRLDAGLTGASSLLYSGDPELGNINLSDFSSVNPK